jgi:Legume lectin domain/PEP-CTERM motif
MSATTLFRLCAVRRFILPACLLAFCLAPSRADQFTYPGFSSTAGLTFVGSAGTAVTLDGTVLRLTPAQAGQAGAAYHTSPFMLGASDTFSTTFQFRFTNAGGIDPADGITFVLAASPTGLGSGGGALGYGGVPNSVAIEFDTYNNASIDNFSSNHVGIDTGGALNDMGLANVYSNGSCGFTNGFPAQNPNTVPGCMSNGNLWTVNVSYDGSKLSVSLKDSAELSPFIAFNSFPINIASALGTNNAFVGFTAGTGSGFENQDIINWTFANTAQISNTPEPSSLLLLGSGLMGLAGILWRKLGL